MNVDIKNLKIKHEYCPLLMITATRQESNVLRQLIPSHKVRTLSNLRFYQFSPFDLYLLETGVGMKIESRKLEKLVKLMKPALILNFGICGALRESIQLLDNYLVRFLVSTDGYKFNLSPWLDDVFRNREIPFPATSLLTVNRPVSDQASRRNLLQQTGCSLVDMEAFKLAQIIEKYSIPFLVMKQVSDRANQDTDDLVKRNTEKWQQHLSHGLRHIILTLEEKSM